MHKALGRGLESLLSVQSAPRASADGGETVSVVPIDKIKANRYQPRHHFNEEKLKELAHSIKVHGLAQPLLVTPTVVPGEYELIAGERRLRASKIAGLTQVPVVIRQANDKERFQISLIENIQREDLNPIEEARAYKRLSHEFELIQEELAKVLGKDRSVVANAMRLLNLPQDIQDFISSGMLSPGHGRILAGIEDENTLIELAKKIMNEKLSVRELESLASGVKDGRKTEKKKTKKTESELAHLAEELQRKFGTKVKIAGSPKKGKIEIHYYSLKELERIAAMLKTKKH
ncbi:MAG TPA: hypothetical protein DEE98_08605 [Elusimicrobia bacterium]|nr:MAG: hypothetical protein A2278_05195 [Elusimicrobia bacterium RIFOXYA12_FULL_49_49]OGS10204.1 MAG: hypothetical protein A2386_00720 [Elusimicrobia bacterium RIFOXYB1_FULL_48_9]OGS15226.1 MAG: hypothetical protein A2251_06925 [Elusimicrobia bacterium RIFOXYA2_FULL_47_53]OGS25919.1 MAG: hypothetical protein A2339_00880 [Elusimicrobia bacterium RIFOXYB12_FULL_50_12]OGS30277.1 MAG: hypothetical protein A2323_05500 [Elusimicrobia bacterium RIFOXYB2_FULL_46_23]HBU70422.1 hypothetical protein [El